VVVGHIRRRLLINFRVDPTVIRPLVPGRFEVITIDGSAIAGVCMISLADMRPRVLPIRAGLTSENAAYRVAVRWNDGGARRDGVFVLRRYTSSILQERVGALALPGHHRHAAFDVNDDGESIGISCRSADGGGDLSLGGRSTDRLASASVFRSVADASAFFERGSTGYSPSRDGSRLDGTRLTTRAWEVRPFQLDAFESSFFDDATRFPRGSIEFDDALVMRDIAHEWHVAPPLSMDGETA
jgi:hypothetical protein